MKKKYLIYISLLFLFNSVIAQQFNTDNHMTMAYGTANNCVTYGNTTDGSRGPGVEIGVLIISPPFLFD